MLRKLIPWFVLIALSLAFRAPILLNAHELNADVAVVGLQARHMLSGEFSWFLWGSGYQSSVDSAWAALWFLVFGDSPRVLLLSALSLHIALTCLVYALLRRRLPDQPRAAFALACILVFTTAAVHSFALYPPRQAALTLAFAAICSADYASSFKWPRLAFGAVGVLGGLACFADPYALLVYPACILMGVLAVADDRKDRLMRATFLLVFALFGKIPDILLRHSAGAQNGPMRLSTEVFAHNWQLLTEVCGPWALGARTYTPAVTGPYQLWSPAPLIGGPLGTLVASVLHSAQTLAAASFLLGSLSGIGLVFAKKLDWQKRRVGLVGALGVLATLASFLVSVMVMDHFSMRYLAALTLFAPLGWVPLASILRAKTVAVLAPYLASAAFSGYLSFGEWLRVPVKDGTGYASTRPIGEVTRTEDAALLDFLAANHVQNAMADYWVAYRLGFLAHDDLAVVPANVAEDRYIGWRVRFTQARAVAYVYDARRSYNDEHSSEAYAKSLGVVRERKVVGAYVVYLIDKRR